jgi:hypothetical protein
LYNLAYPGLDRTTVTAPGVEKFQQALPKCKLVREPPKK